MAVTTVKTGTVTEAEYSNVKDTFPKSIAALAGTVSTGSRKDKIVGVLTTFKDELVKGDFIWFTTTDELIEVLNVRDDLSLTLIKETAGALSGVAYKVVKRVPYKTISCLVDDVDAAEINTISCPKSTSKTYGSNKGNGEGGGRRLAPVLIDSTINGNIVLVQAE